ncbi:hypothetical protein DN597_24260 [Enterobacter cloacae]|nr:hypothetical protein DN597_24260 [Enterobacter cloacae]
MFVSSLVIILKQRTQPEHVFGLQIRASKRHEHPTIALEDNIHQLKRLFFNQQSIYAGNFSFYQKVKCRLSIKHSVTHTT